jgi:hypothetical protein
MGVILLEREVPRLRLIRLIPLGNGYRYLMAEGQEPLEVFVRAFGELWPTQKLSRTRCSWLVLPQLNRDTRGPSPGGRCEALRRPTL